MRSLSLLACIISGVNAARVATSLNEHHYGPSRPAKPTAAWPHSTAPTPTVASPATPTAVDAKKNVTYQGFHRDQVETFYGIPFAQDTGGENRFKDPIPYEPVRGSVFAAKSSRPACPQALGATAAPLYLSDITDISEDCLHLNIYRPNNTKSSDKLPILLYIHGGSFVLGSKDELVNQPGGLILESVANGSPIIHVTINYRLGVFGFAQSAALEQQRSENAGLKDQRLGIEWVKKNIGYFGGDPDQITIHGQSSGGLAIGMQILAYGGSKPFPFNRAICQSQALEPGITGNFTRQAMANLVAVTRCNATSLDSGATVSCLRSLPTQELLQAQLDTYSADPSANIGDSWLPIVDNDFLPAAPSDLITQRRFANVSTMIGWCDDDVAAFTPTDIVTEADTYTFLHQYQPDFTNASLNDLLKLYPTSDFQANPSANLSAQFYRTARIFRDIIMTCQPIHLGDALASAGNDVYYYDQNQTILTPILESVGAPGLGVVHTSDFAYMFGNLSHYDVNNYPYHPNATDFALARRESRSFASFVAYGNPSPQGKDTLRGWETAYKRKDETSIYVVGGAREGLSAEDGPRSFPAIAAQKLRARCGFLNRADIVKQLAY